METDMKNTAAAPCPVCGYYMFSAPDSESEICAICNWHNDILDLEKMYEPVGPNHVSLEQAQKNFFEFGAVEVRFKNLVRHPLNNDIRDSKWRPLDRAKDKPGKIYFDKRNLDKIYYWRWG